MSFLAPGLLLGTLAVSIPLVLHFFYKARYRKQPWAAMSFLRTAIEQTSRRVRFQELILLLLRCAVLLLLAFGLARPSIRGAFAGGRGEAVDAVFVFDTSGSMTARDGEKSRLDRAKDAAQSVIDNLPANSTVQVIVNSDRAAHLGPQSPGNLDQARQLVAGIKPTAMASDVLPGLGDAFLSLDRGAGANKEIYLFTDLQKTGWERQSAAVKAKAEEIKQRATLLLVRCGSADRPPRNVAVADITYPGGIPHTGTRMPFTVLVRNTGTEPVRGVSVTLELDGKPLEKEGETIAEIGPGQTLPVTLTAKLENAGPRVVTAKIQPDDLPADNRLDKIIAVREQVRVLIVDGNPDLRDPKEAGSHFVRNALLPVAAADQDDYFVRVTVVPPEEAGPGLLGAADVCFLTNVAASNADIPGIPGLSPAFVARLKEFVTGGGGLIIGGGDRIVPARYNAVLGDAGLLPFRIAEPKIAPEDKPFKIAADGADAESFLVKFRDDPFRTVTADADVMKVFGVTEAKPGDPADRVLMRLSDGSAFVTAKTIGTGDVIFVAGSFDTRWGNWPAKGNSFLPFVRYALAALTGKAAFGANRHAGEAIIYHPTENAKTFESVRPDGTRDRLGPAAGATLTVTAPETPDAGVYTVIGEGWEPKKGTQFAVSADPVETANLDCLTDADAESLLGFKPVFLQAGSGAEQAITVERTKREWTVWVLLAVFLLAVGESAWAWFCGRAF